ncbi:MAG: hypothetical protein IPG89_05265 [Bacteroidetes bacterium]|nr:hypothetical protein [Bacteroidota bacterium]
MNKILILFSCFLVSCFGFAQAPQSFKYQAVARNSDGTMMINSNMVVRVSIRDSSLVGNVVYQESHNVTTNALGIINLSIGKGFVLQGVFVNIPWGSGEKFIEIEMDMGAGYLIH